MTPAARPARRTLPGGACAALLLLVVATGCEKAKQQQAKRTGQKREAVEARYEELAFLPEALDDAPRKKKRCDDDAVRKGQERSPRACRRLALVDEAYLRALFEEGARVDDDELKRWAWMRTGAFEDLLPLDELEEQNEITRHARVLEGLEDTLVGVFSANEASGSPPKRYQGWLRLYDVKDEVLWCQLPLDLSVEKVFDPPRRVRGGKQSPRQYIRGFRRALDRELRTITKNFCAE